MMKEKKLGTEREIENIYFSLYPCSGFDSTQDKTCLGDINSTWKYGLSFAFVAREVQEFASSIVPQHQLRLQQFWIFTLWHFVLGGLTWI